MEHNNEHVLVLSCPHCGHQAEHTIISILDSKENAYEKQKLMSNTFFEYNCTHCNARLDLCFEMIYRDNEHNALIYLVHDNDVEGASAALRLNDALEIKYGPDVIRPWKRIVTCPHRLREKALIFDKNLDDRVIELAKIFCANSASEAMPDFYPNGAIFNVKNDEFVIELVGEDKTVTAKIPDGFYQHLEAEFAEVLECSNPYVVDEYWAMDVIGIDPYDYEVDCDGDCENCPKNCEDDFDEDEECMDCQRDCEDCDCLRCEEDWDEDDGLECDGNCAGCHGCGDDEELSEDDKEEWDDADHAEEDD